ncbi:MAG: 3-hydroxyacyl-ACP dehydratase FabZ [Legionella sp.]|nr:3-hydroxyacyl-ACP dehydratase FabZ [Legionella sp.]
MSDSTLDIRQILELLPHRYPILLVDKVIDYKPFEYLKALKNVSINEPIFTGHFPKNPVMPGVLMLEALAQACGILSAVSEAHSENTILLFAGIDKAKFKQIVVPGDQLRLEVRFVGKKREFWRMHGEAFVGEKLACSADLLSAVKEVK